MKNRACLGKGSYDQSVILRTTPTSKYLSDVENHADTISNVLYLESRHMKNRACLGKGSYDQSVILRTTPTSKYLSDVENHADTISNVLYLENLK